MEFDNVESNILELLRSDEKARKQVGTVAMLFSSPLFLFLFLPVVLLVYFAVPRRLRNSFLVLASILFYAWGQGVYSIVMLLSMSINYFFGRLIEDHRNQSS